MLFTDADALKQIDELLADCEGTISRAKNWDCSDVAEGKRVEIVTRVHAALTRLAPLGSSYITSLEQLIAKYPALDSSHMYFRQLPGLLRALRADYAAGYLRKISELIHADLFSDFLEMADHLLEEGYKDPAAVLSGGVLEEHLRKLCDKHGITTVPSGHPKKAEAMNTELAAVPAYSKLDQKNVTAWLDLRNKAAHGKYGEYTTEQVRLLVQSIRDFLTRNPA